MPTDLMTDLTREDFLAMMRSPDSPANLEWKISPTGIIDADQDTGVVTAIVAVTGIVDEVDDVIVPGAFKRTLAKRIPKGVWSHDIHTWVSRTDGIGELMPGDPRLPSQWKGKPWPKDAGALIVRTAFNLGTRDGSDAYSNVVFFDAGPLGPQVEWSIGYNSIPGLNKRDRKGVRWLEDVDLYEYGPVLFGAMPLAGTVGTKARVFALEHKGAVVTESTIIGNLELKVAGKEASPKDVKNTERLKQYWEHGAGAAKIQWGRPGDFDRCVRELSKYLPPNQVKGYCLAGETLVTTIDGPVPIAELAEAGRATVLSVPDADQRRGPGRVVRRDGVWRDVEVQSFGEQRLLTITLERYGDRKVIRATPEHLWFASPDGRTASRHTLRQMPTSDLRPGMVLGSVLPLPVVHTSLPSPVGVAAGAVFGDGSLRASSGASIDLWGDKDEQLIRYFDGHSTSPVKTAGGVLGTRVRGLPASWKRQPSLDEGVPYLYGWLAGYFAADGTVTKDGAVSISSARREDLEFAALVAHRLGIATHSIREHNRVGLGVVESPLYRLTFVGATVPEAMLVIAEHRANLGASDRKATPVRWRVVSVEDHGEAEEVFCAVVPGPEQFVLDGWINTHNCANRHKGATGGWPGHAPGVEQAEADAKKAAKEKKDLGIEDAAAELLDGLEGKADKRPGSMGDGSFPITDGTSLKKAIKAHARAKDPAKAKRHIKKRAKAIGCEHMIPDQWRGTKDAAVDTLETGPLEDDGGLAEAVAILEEFEALGFTDDEIDAALADAGEFSSLPEGIDPDTDDGDDGDEEGDGDGDEDRSAGAALGINGEHKAARAVASLTVGDRVLELKHASGMTSGQVKAMSARAGLVGLGIQTEQGMETVWVPNDATCSVAYDPYAELKSGMTMVAERKDYPYLPGSVEERQNEITEAVRDLLLPEPDDEGRVRAYVSLDATFADYVVATLNDYSMPGPDDEQSFVIPYTVGADGGIDLGQPAPVEKQVVIVPGGDADDQGADQPNAGGVMGGMDPSLNLARKVLDGAKALLDTLETKAAEGADLSGTHVRRLRAAEEAISGALTGLGEVTAGETKSADLGEVARLLAEAALV